MKKIISALIAVILLIQSVAYSADEGVSNIKVVVKNDEVTVTADVDKIGKSYAMTVVKEGGSPKNSDDLFDMSETKSTENKQVQFTFSMPDERNGKKTDGRYIGYIKGKGGVKSEFSFEYATEQGRNEAMEAIVGATASQMLDYFEVSSQYRAGLASSGFDFYDYDNFSESEKREVCRLMEKNIDNGDADVIFSQSVLLSKINSADDIYEWIVKSNVKFNEVTHDKNTGNKFIEDIIVRERKYDSIEKFQSQYRIANILYECNNSRFATIGDNLRKYADELNLTSSDDYNRYIRLQGSDLNAVNDGIIIYLSKNPAKNTQGILSAINSGLSNVKDNNTYKSSGSSSRSEILGGAGSFANVQKPNDNAIDNTPIYTGTGFTDLDSVPWAESAIKSLYDKKIVSGTGNGLYEPQRNVRREEFVKMIVCAIGLNSESRETEFDDVGKGAWYEGYIAVAVSNKIIEGIGNNLFGVGEYITRQDMAVIVERALNINEEVDAVFKFKDDSDISDYAKDAIYKLYAADIINGMENVYNPTALSTRAEAAVIINNMLNYLYQLNGADSVTNASPYKKMIDTLLGLGILEGISAEGFNEDGAIQRQVFVNAVVSMAVDGDLSDEQSIEYAKGVGLISNAEYDIHGYITYEEAAAALVNMLGYGKTYENKDPLSAAGELRLLKDVKSVTGEYAKSGDVIQMLYNALDIPVMKMLSITPGGGTTLIVDRKQNILSACHGIEKVKGIVTSNEDTSLNAEASLSSGKVTIDGSIYDAGNSGAEKFLGFSTVAYIKLDDSGDGEILYIEEDRNNITELSAEMLEDVDLSDRVIMYCKTPTDKKLKKIKLSPVLKIIYNGTAYPNYSEDDIKIKSGRLKVVDNDNDNVFDVLFVEDYKTIVADSVSKNNKSIYNIYNTPEKITYDEDIKWNCYLNGNRISYTDIQRYTVLSVMENKDTSNKIITIEACNKSINGIVTSIDSTENKVQIGNEVYKLSDGYMQALERKDPSAVEIGSGKRYDFYFDIFGEIAYVTEGEDTYIYLLARKIYDDEFEVFLRAMTMQGTWQTYQFADKVKYTRGTNSETDKKEDLYNVLGGRDGFERQLLKVRLNNQGQIKEVVTAQNVRDEKVFNVFTASSDLQWGVNNWSFESKLFIPASTPVIIMPDEESAEEEYSVTSRSYFVVDKTYPFIAYDVDDYKNAGVVIVTGQAAILSTNMFVVDKISMSLVDDEIVQAATGVFGEYEDYMVFGVDNDVFEDLHRGDMIALGVRGNGRIWAYEMYFSPYNDYGKLSYSKPNASDSRITGFITGMRRDTNQIKVDCGEGDDFAFPVDSGANIVLYDRNDKNISRITSSDIEIGDYVMMYISWSKIRTMVVVRN